MGVLAFSTALALAAGASVFWLLHPYVLGRRPSAIAGVCVGLLAAGLLALPWPGRPLGAVLHERGRAEWKVLRLWEEVRERRVEARFEQAAFHRFDGVVEFVAAPGGSRDGWTLGAVGDRRAWLDESSGLVWGEGLDLEPGEYAQEDWKESVAACAAAAPAGRWALPSMPEFLRARKNGLPERHGRWFATVFLPDMHAEMMGLFIAGPSDDAESGDSGVGTRCVARTAKAPAEGYPVGTNEDLWP